MRKPTITATLLAVLTLAVFAPCGAKQLGTVAFPTSASPEAQERFERGLALLHSFQYDEADQLFSEAIQHDSRCAMCHWGKAMALYHQIWDWPSDDALRQGHTELELANRPGALTARERGFISALAVFFQETPKLSHVRRIAQYSQALERLHRQVPRDVEASSFYALSLIALAGEDVDTMSNLRRAITLLRPLLAEYPGHPGVAHYLIHAADRPELATFGLEAARRYADLAPDSSHALHMPSHIFGRLGLWQESIAVNLRAANAGARLAAEHRGDSNYQMHALDYLVHAYLQTGQESKARHILDDVHVPPADEGMVTYHRAYFLAKELLDLHRWQEAAAVPLEALPPAAIVDSYKIRTIGAARIGDLPAARRNLTVLREAVAARAAQRRRAGYRETSKPLELQEAEAWVAYAEGRTREAINGLQDAANRDDKSGGESVGVPAREMLADLFLELKRPEEALAAYRTVLKVTPNRFNSLVGAGQAAEAMGDRSLAKQHYEKLVRNTSPDADRPELDAVKAFLARN